MKTLISIIRDTQCIQSISPSYVSKFYKRCSRGKFFPTRSELKYPTKQSVAVNHLLHKLDFRTIVKYFITHHSTTRQYWIKYDDSG